MNANLKYVERTAVLATLDPVSQSAATVVTAWVPVANFHRVAAVLQTGVMTTSSTIDAKLRQATDSSGTSAKDIANKAITQLVGPTNNSNQVVIEANVDDLDANNGFCYVALSVTVGTAASLIAAQLLGVNPRFAPASAFNQTNVKQMV
jgi:hypothetical protein